jgi:peptidoglycan-associated lipoprotein
MKIARLIGLFALLVTVNFTLSAQKNYKAEADIAFSGFKYYKAIEMYKKAYTKATKNEVKSEILFQIAECYNGKNDGKQAAVWYGKAIKAKYQDPIAIFKIAEIFKSEARYEDAISNYEKYKASRPDDKRADLGIESCKAAKKWLDEPTRIIVNPKPLINSEDFDFSPVFADKKYTEIYFTSTRQGSTGDAVSDVTGMNFDDIYKSKIDKKGKWSEPVVLNSTVNSPASEGSSCLNKKKNEIYFTRCEVKKNGIAGCGIMKAKKSGQEWGEPEYITIIGAEDSMKIRHPAISPDDKMLVFSADLPGGQGGIDLWYITFDKKAKTWSKPTNLGAEINTPENEAFPYIRDNGDLYFSSNGHVGMGGLDLYKATSTGANQWSGVENLKSPMNSSSDDFGVIFEGNKEKGLFNTGREGGKGGDDIWEFYLPPMLFSLKVFVKDIEKNEPLPNAKIKLLGTDGTVAEGITAENGEYVFAENGQDRYINKETSYSLVVEKDKYLVAKGKETTVGLEKGANFEHTYELQPFKDVVIKLPLIEYETAKWDLQPQYKDSLNYLFNIMVDNPTLIIQLRSHTDYRGSDVNNKRLSQKRAQSCVDYLVNEKGVHPDRILAKGMGESEPIKGLGDVILTEKYITSLATKEEKDIALQRNRRTDFKVISSDFVPKAKEAQQGTK